LHLDGQAVDDEACRGGTARDGAADSRIVDLGHVLAVAADQELTDMVAVGPRAADEGVARFQAMDEALFKQEIERALDRRRGGAAAVALQGLEQRIGPDGRMAAPDEFQHASADVGEPGPALFAQHRRAVESIVDAVLMIVRLGAKRRRRRRFPGHDCRRQYASTGRGKQTTRPRGPATTGISFDCNTLRSINGSRAIYAIEGIGVATAAENGRRRVGGP